MLPQTTTSAQVQGVSAASAIAEVSAVSVMAFGLSRARAEFSPRENIKSERQRQRQKEISFFDVCGKPPLTPRAASCRGGCTRPIPPAVVSRTCRSAREARILTMCWPSSSAHPILLPRALIRPAPTERKPKTNRVPCPALPPLDRTLNPKP